MEIDVFYKDYSEDKCLAIELKQYAKEGKCEDDTSQLDKYERLVEELIEKADRPITFDQLMTKHVMLAIKE